MLALAELNRLLVRLLAPLALPVRCHSFYTIIVLGTRP